MQSSTDITLDIRIIKTNKAIIDAFIELLMEKHFKKITVQEICANALVNRGTFYAHFQDKYQLLMQMLYDKMSAMGDQARALAPSKSIIDYYTALCTLTIDYLYQNDNSSRIKLQNTDNELVFESMHSFMVLNTTRLLEERVLIKGAVTIPVNILVEFFSGGTLALIKWWLISDVKIKRSQLEHYTTSIIRSFLTPYL